MECQAEIEQCLEEFDKYPLYIPTKILAQGSAFCLKRAYFNMFLDIAPLSHTPLKINLESQKVHDILAYIVPRFTYEYLHGSNDPEEVVDKIWDLLREDVERFSNISDDDYKRLRSRVINLIKGYTAVLKWFSSNYAVRPDETYVFTERMIISRSTGQSFLPTIGVPDVMLYNHHVKAGVVVDWKLHYRKGGNKPEYVQLAIYRHLLEKITDSNIYAFLIYTTEKREDIKVISLNDTIILDKYSTQNVKIEYKSIPNAIKSAEVVASFLYSLVFCRDALRQIIKIAPSCGIMIFSPERGHRPCKYCLYREICQYRFTKSERLPKDIADIRKVFNKLYRTSIFKKSQDHKLLVDSNKCVEFDRGDFIAPTVLLLEKRLRGVSDALDKKVLRYALGRTTVYVFSKNDPLVGNYKDMLSPLLFGRYDSDDIEKREEKDQIVLTVPVRMISPTFSNRWLPLYTIYKYNSTNPIFKNLVVCKGRVSMADVELKAIASIENAIVRDRTLDSFIKKKLEDIIRQASYEYD